MVVTVVQHNRTVLMQVACDHRVAVVKHLISQGADITTMDDVSRRLSTWQQLIKTTAVDEYVLRTTGRHRRMRRVTVNLPR